MTIKNEAAVILKTPEGELKPGETMEHSEKPFDILNLNSDKGSCTIVTENSRTRIINLSRLMVTEKVKETHHGEKEIIVS